jgi:hypothetical protein
MRAIDPIFVTPRFVHRDWGRCDVGEWGPSNSIEPIAEAWLHDVANATEEGPLGRKLAANSQGMLGDLGRAPPKVRMVFPGKTMSIQSTAPVSLWTVLEPGNPSLADDDATFHRLGERIRAYEGASVTFSAGSVALEISSAFLPTNDGVEGPLVIRLPPVWARWRATLFRDVSFSVESWMLPERSHIVPDGQTCHVLTAVTPGVNVDGRRLPPGQTVFVPACGRQLDITASNVGARVIVAYPDAAPTSVWRFTPEPDPAAGRLAKPRPSRPRVGAVSPLAETAMAA